MLPTLYSGGCIVHWNYFCGIKHITCSRSLPTKIIEIHKFARRYIPTTFCLRALEKHFILMIFMLSLIFICIWMTSNPPQPPPMLSIYPFPLPLPPSPSPSPLLPRPITIRVIQQSSNSAASSSALIYL